MRTQSRRGRSRIKTWFPNIVRAAQDRRWPGASARHPGAGRTCAAIRADARPPGADQQRESGHAAAHQNRQRRQPPDQMRRVQHGLQQVLQPDQRAAHADGREQDARQAPPAARIQRELTPTRRDRDQAERIHPAGGGGRECNPDMGEAGIEPERHRQHDVHRHGGDGDLDRRQRVLPREEPRHHDLDQHEGGQAEGIGGQRRRHLGHLMRAELPALEQHMRIAWLSSSSATAAGSVSSKASSSPRFWVSARHCPRPYGYGGTGWAGGRCRPPRRPRRAAAGQPVGVGERRDRPTGSSEAQ